MNTVATHCASEIEQIQELGYCVLRGLLSKAMIATWNEHFTPYYRCWRAKGLPDNRGPHRNYLDLPFAHPFADQGVYEHAVILQIVEGILGPDVRLLHLGTDTPEFGSEDQGVHSDLMPLFPGSSLLIPTYALAVNFPLVDVTQDNGPFMIAEGTHVLEHDEGQRRIRDGEIAMRPLLMERGDVLIRDPRTLHRGSRNHTQHIRPMVVMAYHRPWLRHPNFEPISLNPAARESLSERGKRLMDLHLNHHRSV